MTELCLTPAEVERHLAGLLDEQECARVEDHLSVCRRCRDLYLAWRAGGPPSGDSRGTEDTISVQVDRSHPRRPQTDAPLRPGLPEAIPGYEIIDEIYQGGQGVVYRAVQTQTRRTVALKVLREHGGVPLSQEQRFKREIELIAGLRHPSIVTVFDAGVVKGRRYYAMEYIEGQSLSHYLRKTRLSVTEFLRLFLKIASAVAFAHRRGIIHRDLKPSNIQIDLEGEPHILDFGLAKASASAATAEQDVTVSGEFLGTLAYAAPEQTTGDARHVDARADVYALGVVLYEGLTGEKPYTLTGDLAEVLYSIVGAEVKPPSLVRPEIDGDVDAIVLTATTKDRERRYPTADELVADVDRFLRGLPVSARRGSTAYAALKHLKRWITRHTVAACLSLAVVSIVPCFFLYRSGLFVKGPDRRFESAARRFMQGTMPRHWSPDVVVIALDDATHHEIDRLARSEGLTDVRADNTLTYRKLHGAMMRRLALARPKVVAWDITFISPMPGYDVAFTEGMAALQAAGARVILGFRALDEDHLPQLSPVLAEQADGTGWVTLLTSTEMIHGASLAVAHPPLPPTPSLGLLAYAHSRHPDCIPHLEWDTVLQYLIVRYARLDRHRHGEPQWLDDVDRIWIGQVKENWQGGAPNRGHGTERCLLATWSMIPASAVLERSTVSYRNVFAWDEVRLRQQLEGKIVLIGDNRLTTTTDPDRGRLDDGRGGRDEFHCYMHAAAICDLLNRAGGSIPPFLLEIFAFLVAGCTGTVIGITTGHRHRGPLCCLVAVAAAAAAIAVSFLIAATTSTIMGPSAPILVVWLTSAGAFWIARTAQRHFWILDFGGSTISRRVSQARLD